MRPRETALFCGRFDRLRVLDQAVAWRAWVAEALIGTGLTRHVPTTEVKLAADQVFDSFLASTKGLTLELIAALRQ